MTAKQRVFLLVLGVSLAFAAVPREAGAARDVWARQFGGADKDYATGVAMDGLGTTFVTGHFQKATTLESVQLTSVGLSDLFVAALDREGKVVWAHSLGGPGADEARAIAAGAQGEIYVTGSFSGTVDFDPGPGRTELTSAGSGGDAFLAKLNAEGQLVWARRLGGSLGDVGLAVTADSKGAVVTGSFQGKLELPSPSRPLEAAGREDAFVARFDAAGQLLWARRIGGAQSDAARGAALAADGSLWLVGSFEEKADFGPEGGSMALASAGKTDGFLVHLDAAGGLLWSGSFGGPAADAPEEVAVNGTGVAVIGQFSGTADLAPGAATMSFSSSGKTDVFVSRFTTSGQLRWVRRLGEKFDDFGHGVELDRFGNTIIAAAVRIETNQDQLGDSRSQMTVFDREGENRLTRDMAATHGIQVLALTLDLVDNPCVAGVFRGTATVIDGREAVRLQGNPKGNNLFVARIVR